MALSYAYGKIDWFSADAATHVYTVSGLSFQPKALRFYWSGIIDAGGLSSGSATSHIRRGIGFATSTSDRRCVGSLSEDNAASAVCTTGYRTDAVAMTLTSAPAADGLLDLNSITSDGFTLVVDDASPVDLTINWEAWGGNDVGSAATGEITEPAATGNVDYTVTGSFQPSVVMFAGVQETGAANVSSRNDSGLYAGFASSGAAANNIVVLGNSDDGSATMDCDGYALDGECVAMIAVAGGNPSARAQMTQFNSNGFRLNWIARATTGRKSIYLAIQGGVWAAGGYTIDDRVVGNTATVSGLPFAPVGASFIGRGTTKSTAGTATANDSVSLGSASPGNNAITQASFDINGAATSAVEVHFNASAVLTPGTNSVLSPIVTDIGSGFTTDGFSVSIESIGGVSAEWQGYLAFGTTVRPPQMNTTVLLEAMRRSTSW